MKKCLFILIIMILSFTACTAAPAPMVTVLETPAGSSSSEPSPSLPEGYVPDVKSTGSYTANSGNNLYEDEEYIIFRNGSGIIVFDKNKNSVADILPRCSAFTYCDKKVYYIGYDADTRKRNITEYSVTSGSEKEIYQMDNTAVSMLEYNGRLYYAYPTDPKSITASELRSVALDGSDMRKIKAQGIENFVIKGDYVYYTEAYTNKDYIPYLYKLSLSDGSKVKVSNKLSKPYRFELSGDTLLYPAGDFYIGSYDIQTGKTSLTPDIADWSDWSCDFTILGQHIILTAAGDFTNNKPSFVRAYDLDSGNLYELAEPDFDDYDLYATVNGVYISPNKPDGTSKLFKVVISGGKASLKEIINYSPDKKPSSDTVIIASSYGGIYGGYSGGTWLTHSEAAAYCKDKMTFNEYNLAGLKGTVESSGVTCDDTGEGYIVSHTYKMPPDTWDENAYIALNIPEKTRTAYDYPNEPLCFSNLYYGGKIPDVEIVSDASELSGAVQSLIDEKIGSGNAKANIRIAVNADIDGDGEKETVVNADNCAEEYFNSEGDDKDAAKKYWYCLSCIIESDGTVKVIDHYYFIPTPDKPADYEESYTYYEDAQFMYVQNIIDIDGDGRSELILDWSGWEAGETTVYKYDGNNIDDIMYYSSGV